MDLDVLQEPEGSDAIHEPAWKRPLVIIAAVFILLIFVISVVPWFYLELSPPPDLDELKYFNIKDYEMQRLIEIPYEHTASISGAIEQINVADYRIVTNQLVSSVCSEHSDLCYAKAIYYYVQSLQYVSDPDYQYVQSPAETIYSGAGDCEDKSLLTSAMLESIGVDADIGVTSNHAFVRAQVSGALWGDGYTWMDPTSSNEFGEVSFTNKDVVGWYEVA